MLSFSSKHRYLLYLLPADMRKSFNGLSGIVNQHLDHPLLSGDVFIFINRRRDRIKLLMWDATGFALYYKRLEQGTFELPKIEAGQTSCEMTWRDLVMLLEGVKLSSIKMRKRYRRTR